jgi:hypothetical protein
MLFFPAQSRLRVTVDGQAYLIADARNDGT